MSREPRLAGLDGLRGIAALAIYGVHFNQVVELDAVVGYFDLYRLLGNGEYGVALFFVLSGYLLGLPFWRARLDGVELPNVRRYAFRRVARIVPAYYFCLLVLVLWGGRWQSPDAMLDILLHITFLFNYAEFSIFSINAPFWTLAVEMQFYLLLPLIFLTLRRLTPDHATAAMIAIGVIAYLIHAWLVSSITQIIDWPTAPMLIWVRPYGAVVNHSLPGHVPHFLIGVIAGRFFLSLQSKLGVRTGRWPWAELVFWSTSITLFLLLATEFGDKIHIPYGRYGLPFIPLLLAVLILATPFTHYARKFLESAPLKGLGTLSYGIYIYHLPCLIALDRYLRNQDLDAAQYPFLYGIGGMAITLSIALLSYVVVEHPALRWVHGGDGRASGLAK